MDIIAKIIIKQLKNGWHPDSVFKVRTPYSEVKYSVLQKTEKYGVVTNVTNQ
jgi:hypothetical protein